jgi:UDP-N-acetylmuramoyl-tripeptide--D-alanyl-D-alanine ligase
MRCERLEHAGAVIWNDCYNANPDAMRSMLDLLAGTPARRRIAVLGEMLELGRAGEDLHRQVGRYAAGRGLDILIGIRGEARAMVEEARRGGVRADFYEAPEDAGDAVSALLQPGDAVLFKGSRGVEVERALERVLAPAEVR